MHTDQVGTECKCHMTLECNYYFRVVFLQATAGEWLVFERFVTSDGAEVTLVPALEFRDLISYTIPRFSAQTCGSSVLQASVQTGPD